MNNFRFWMFARAWSRAKKKHSSEFTELRISYKGMKNILE